MRKQKPDLLATLKPRLQPPCAHWALESDVEMDVRVKTSMTFPLTMIGSPSAIPGVAFRYHATTGISGSPSTLSCS